MAHLFEGFKRILRNIRSEKILNRIGSGKEVYFENLLEEIALKYVPGGPGRIGKYFAKHFGRDEYEIDPDSSCILMGIMEGKQISKSRYDIYHMIEGTYWKRKIRTYPDEKVMDESWAACG